MADISTAIRETHALFKRRNSAEDWAQNLIDGSRTVKTPEQWTKYYAFIANPQNYDPNHEYKVAPLVKPGSYPAGQKEVRYQNGPDEYIYVTNVTTAANDEEDEKNPLG